MMNEDHFLNLQPGTIVNGRYEVVKCLGTGSMGLVYACRHRELAGHLVAMKVLFAEVARDAVAAQRFRNEIVASYGVSHPNVVRAYEYFRDGDLVAFTMEYIGGGDLADRIGLDEIIPVAAIIKMLCQMCSGVQAIHDAGIIHRDLKPENILLTVEGDIKFTDFGIARTGTGPKLTEHGGVVGTIDYVSPEYLERGQVDTRSDIYALGVLAYEMLTGEAPFKGKSVIETMTMRLRSDAPPPSALRTDAPLQFDAIVAKAMARDPEQRYQTARDMLQDLEELAAENNSSSGARALHSSRSGRPAERSAEQDGFSSFSKMDGELDRNGAAGKARHGRRADPILSSTQELSSSMISSLRPARGADGGLAAVEPMESVLRSGHHLADSPISRGVTERPVPRVSVGQGQLSLDRMKQLSRELHPVQPSFLGRFIVWGVFLVLGFGLGVIALREYRPDLFDAASGGGSFVFKFGE